MKRNKIDRLRIMHFTSEGEDAALTARGIAKAAVGFLRRSCCVAGEKADESFRNLREAISRRFHDPEVLANRLEIGEKCSSTLEVLREATCQFLISEKNVDKLFNLSDAEVVKRVKSYKRKWLDD